MHLIFQHDRCNILSSPKPDKNVQYLQEFLGYKKNNIKEYFLVTHAISKIMYI